MQDNIPSERIKLGTNVSERAIEPQAFPYNENLLERVRTQWQFGDWANLAQIESDDLFSHPDRAIISLLVAAGHQQQGDINATRQFARLALEWGCSKKLVGQILIAGLHNTLGRAAVAADKTQQAITNFKEAITAGGIGSSRKLLIQALIEQEFENLGLPKNKVFKSEESNSTSATPKLLFSQALESQIEQLKRENAELVAKGKKKDDELTRLRETLKSTLDAADTAVGQVVLEAPANVDLLNVHAEIAMVREDYREAVRRWHDIAGVLSQNTPQAIYNRLSEAYAKLVGGFGGTAAENGCRGERHKHEILSVIHKVLEPDYYLEVGVDEGLSLSLAHCKAIGVDPRPQLALRKPLGKNAKIIQNSSDEFFSSMGSSSLEIPPDLVFIDGMHFFEFALRDFMNVERYSRPSTIVVIDDIYPCHRVQAERRRRTGSWTGDVWKLHEILRIYRPDLAMISLDAYPTGLLLISGLDPQNHVLWDRYNDIVNIYLSIAKLPAFVIERVGSVACDDGVLFPFLNVIKQGKKKGQLRRDLVYFLFDVINKQKSPQ